MSYSKTAAAFGKLVGICAGYEGKYNPARQNLKITALNKLVAEAGAAIESVSNARLAYTSATGIRKLLFKESTMILKRLRGEAEIMAIDPGTRNLLIGAINNAAAFGKAVNSDPPAENDPPKSRRATGKDFITRQAAFNELVNALAGTKDYQPSSADLSVKSLKDKAEKMKTANDSVNVAYTNFLKARYDRREVFRKPVTGILATARSVKNMVKAIFGNPSNELKAVRSIRTNFS